MQHRESTVLHQLVDAIDRRVPVASATVVETDRSVPRHAGARMLIWADGTSTGTIGGGEMEARVIVAGVEALESGVPALRSFDLVDPAAGDPGVCGGSVSVYVEPHMPTPTLLIIGAGHVGAAVHELASWLGMRAVLWDDRDDAPEMAEPAEVQRGELSTVMATAGIDTTCAVVIVSRNMAVDLEVVPQVLATPAGYVGLMGSERRWATTRDALHTAGVSEDALARLHAPIGIEIEAETPQEIAVSILAEVIQHQRGG